MDAVRALQAGMDRAAGAAQTAKRLLGLFEFYTRLAY